MIALVAAGLLLFGAVAVFWQLRAIRRNETAAMGVAEAFDRRDPATHPAERRPEEARPGTDLAQQDALELLFSLPALDPELTAGRARLQQAIDDDTTQGEQ